MRNPRSKLTDRLELLRLPQRFFRALPLGDLRGQSFVCGSKAAGSFSATRRSSCSRLRVKVSRASTMSVMSVQVPNHLTIQPLLADWRAARLEPAILAVGATNPELRGVLVLPF